MTRSSKIQTSVHVPSSTPRSIVSVPPLKVLFVFSRTQRGPRSRTGAGSSRCHRSRGSRMWSSTEMMRGKSSSAGVTEAVGVAVAVMGWLQVEGLRSGLAV